MRRKVVQIRQPGLKSPRIRMIVVRPSLASPLRSNTCTAARTRWRAPRSTGHVHRSTHHTRASHTRRTASHAHALHAHTAHTHHAWRPHGSAHGHAHPTRHRSAIAGSRTGHACHHWVHPAHHRIHASHLGEHACVKTCKGLWVERRVATYATRRGPGGGGTCCAKPAAGLVAIRCVEVCAVGLAFLGETALAL